MTEATWHSSLNSEPMIDWLDTEKRFRKSRLFAAACCRRVWMLLTDPMLRAAVEVIERHVDGKASASECQAATRAAADVRGTTRDPEQSGRRAIAEAVRWAVNLDGDGRQTHSWLIYAMAFLAGRPWDPSKETDRAIAASGERMAQANLLRDIFGNPFRTVTFDLAWRTETAVTLARLMYESRDFSAMPILADALQDAGCEYTEVLTHCRDPKGIHVRGCWVVDLVLGKS